MFMCVCSDGVEKFTPAQEQQPVCPDPRHCPYCQHQQKQVLSNSHPYYGDKSFLVILLRIHYKSL